MSNIAALKIDRIKHISGVIYNDNYRRAEMEIGSRCFRGFYIRVPYNTPTSMTNLLESRELKLRFENFSEGYYETGGELKLVADRIRSSNSIPSIPARYSITRHYLRLLGIEYKVTDLNEARMHDIPLLVAEGYGDELLTTPMNNHYYERIRIMIDSGYVPSQELMKSLIPGLLLKRTHIIIITLPLPWTDEIYYQLARLVFKDVAADNPHYIDLYRYFIFFDSAYQPFWDGLKRYIRDHPECKLFHPLVMEFINHKIIPCSIREAYEMYADDDEWMIADYNIPIFRDPLTYKEHPFKRFCRLATESDYHIYDPRLFKYWQELCQPENHEILNKLIDKNPTIAEYLDYRGLYSIIDVESERNLWRLVHGVMTGEFHYTRLPEDHPIRELLKSRNTKSSRKA
jgi:hypothetical protein